MFIRVGNHIYSAERDDIVGIWLSDKDKENIRNMSPEARVYSCRREEVSERRAVKWNKDFRQAIEEELEK